MMRLARTLLPLFASILVAGPQAAASGDDAPQNVTLQYYAETGSTLIAWSPPSGGTPDFYIVERWTGVGFTPIAENLEATSYLDTWTKTAAEAAVAIYRVTAVLPGGGGGSTTAAAAGAMCYPLTLSENGLEADSRWPGCVVGNVQGQPHQNLTLNLP